VVQIQFDFPALPGPEKREVPVISKQEGRMAKQVKSGGARELPPLPKGFYIFVAAVQSGAALKSWTPARVKTTGRRAA
jgi:hypothetical protein